MKMCGPFSRRIFGAAALLFTLASGAGVEPVQAAEAYQPIGQFVTNFTLYTRRQWTNEVGRVFTPGTSLRLDDLAGKIALFEFFDPTCSDCQYAANETIPG